MTHISHVHRPRYRFHISYCFRVIEDGIIPKNFWSGTYTTVYKVFARWADDGSLWQAFVASVRHLAAEKQLDLSVLHGDGTNTVAKKGGMALRTRGINTRRVT